MRILIGSFSAVTVLEGGIKTQVLSLKRELEALGNQVDLFSSWQDYDLKSYDWFYLVGAHLGTVHLARAIKNLGMRLAVSPVFFSRRSVVLVHWQTQLGRTVRLLGLSTDGALTREVCLLADLVLPNTEAECVLLNAGLDIPRGHLRVIPNGGDERFLSAKPDRFVREYGRKDFVLYVGHMGLGRKNLLRLIQAMRGIDRTLVIVAKELDNDYARQCRKAAGELKDCLIISGLAHDSEMLASAYAACDTFCLPSWYETPGLAALEAGLAGAKIVITGKGGTREYFREYARYVAPESVSSIRQALLASLSAPKTDALREHIRAHFLWRHAAEKLLESLKSQDKE